MPPPHTHNWPLQMPAPTRIYTANPMPDWWPQDVVSARFGLSARGARPKAQHALPQLARKLLPPLPPRAAAHRAAPVSTHPPARPLQRPGSTHAWRTSSRRRWCTMLVRRGHTPGPADSRACQILLARGPAATHPPTRVPSHPPAHAPCSAQSASGVAAGQAGVRQQQQHSSSARGDACMSACQPPPTHPPTPPAFASLCCCCAVTTRAAPTTRPGPLKQTQIRRPPAPAQSCQSAGGAPLTCCPARRPARPARPPPPPALLLLLRRRRRWCSRAGAPRPRRLRGGCGIGVRRPARATPRALHSPSSCLPAETKWVAISCRTWTPPPAAAEAGGGVGCLSALWPQPRQVAPPPPLARRLRRCRTRCRRALRDRSRLRSTLRDPTHLLASLLRVGLHVRQVRLLLVAGHGGCCLCVMLLLGCWCTRVVSGVAGGHAQKRCDRQRRRRHMW